MTTPGKQADVVALDPLAASKVRLIATDPAAILRSHTLDWTAGLTKEELRRSGIPEESIEEFFYDRPEE